MTPKEKRELSEKILKRHELYELQNSRLKRLLKDPFRTFRFYVEQSFAYIRPYKITRNTLWGTPMSYYLPEGSMIYYYGFFEANVSNFLIAFLREGDTVYDVGAHVGFYSMLASKIVGKNGQVHSFEPTPRTFDTLNENAARTNNITAVNAAILDKATMIDFYDYGPKYSVFNTFEKRTTPDLFFKDNVEKVSVKAISLDEYTQSKKLSPLFVKIDAEGSEHLVLSSMSLILSKIKPIVSIEVSTVVEWEENLSKALEILESAGYLAHEIDTNGKISVCDPRTPRGYDNLLFIHPSKIDFVAKRIRNF